MNKIVIKELSQINVAAEQFLKLIGSKSIIAFYGEMGAGKTTFSKALCEVLGVEDTVNSPTFTIVNEYRTGTGRPIFHFDFYRINKISEVLDIGFDEYVNESCDYGGDALLLMEWPEKIEELLPEETLKVRIIEERDGSRSIVF